jgi:hypothetical protein
MNVMSVVKFKVKEGFEDKFVKASQEFDYSNVIFWKLVALDDNEYFSISEYDSIDKAGDDEVTGVEWLDSVTHMIEYFGESRTDAASGVVVAEIINVT